MYNVLLVLAIISAIVTVLYMFQNKKSQCILSGIITIILSVLMSMFE